MRAATVSDLLPAAGDFVAAAVLGLLACLLLPACQCPSEAHSHTVKLPVSASSKLLHLTSARASSAARQTCPI